MYGLMCTESWCRHSWAFYIYIYIFISGIGPGNCTKYGICAPWRWSNG